METVYTNPRKTPLKIHRKKLSSLINRIAGLSSISFTAEQYVTINFTDAKTISEINRNYVGHQGVTDVISFDYRSCNIDDEAMAELFICYDKAETESRIRKNATFAREIALYILHGFLHIAGYDDINPPERKKMRTAERSIMKKLEAEFDFSEIFILKK